MYYLFSMEFTERTLFYVPAKNIQYHVISTMKFKKYYKYYRKFINLNTSLIFEIFNLQNY